MGSLNPDPSSLSSSSSPSTTPSVSSSSSLPILLCLHGGGSNNRIFRFQCRRIERQLRHRFRFVYPNASILSKPGFDIVPIFESVNPFYRWVREGGYKPPSGNDEEDIENAPVAPAEEVYDIDWIIREAVQEATASDVDSNGNQGDSLNKIVGIMGFSQGALLTAGLVCREHERRSQSQPQSQSSSKLQQQQFTTLFNLPLPSLKFAVLIGGPSPPIFLHEPTTGDNNRLAGLRTLPTLHAWGRDDHVRPGCEALTRLTDSLNSSIFTYDGRHHLPLTDHETEGLVKEILDCWLG